MIFRPLNLIGFLAAATAGLHLYQTKHEVALMDRELRGLARGIDEAQERTQALHAEWAWLNEPERLRGVAQRLLALEPMQPAQFVRLTEAAQKMPAPVAYAGPAALFAERSAGGQAGPVTLALLPRLPDPIQLARSEAAPVPPPPPPVIVPLPAAPPRIAEPAALPAAPAPLLAAELRPTRPAEPRAEPARALPPIARVAPRPAPRPLRDIAGLSPTAAPGVTPVSVRTAVGSGLAAGGAQVASAPTLRIIDPPATSLGSALGGRPALAPPVPFGSANAATLGGAR